jgi:triphosphoribosyl-dephospho-CoA synthetase
MNNLKNIFIGDEIKFLVLTFSMTKEELKERYNKNKKEEIAKKFGISMEDFVNTYEANSFPDYINQIFLKGISFFNYSTFAKLKEKIDHLLNSTSKELELEFYKATKQFDKLMINEGLEKYNSDIVKGIVRDTNT